MKEIDEQYFPKKEPETMKERIDEIIEDEKDMIKVDFFETIGLNPFYDTLSLMGYNIYTVIVSILSFLISIYLVIEIHLLMAVPSGIIWTLILCIIRAYTKRNITQKGNVEFENINKRGVE